MTHFCPSDTQHGDESATAKEEPQSEEVNQTTHAEEVTSCRSNSTIEPATEPTESVANDSKPSHTGSNDTGIHNDQADTAQTENKVCDGTICCMASSVDICAGQSSNG